MTPLTRQHFELFARTLGNILPDESRYAATHAFASACGYTNPRFDPERFRETVEHHARHYRAEIDAQCNLQRQRRDFNLACDFVINQLIEDAQS